MGENVRKEGVGMANVSNISIQISANANQAINSINQVAKTLDKTLKDVEKRSKMDIHFRAIGIGQIYGALLGLAAFTGFKNLVVESYNLTKSLESAGVSFRVLLGSAEASKQVLKDIGASRVKEVFGGATVRKEVQQLVIAGMTAKDALAIVERVGDAAAASMDNPAENMHRIIMALSQIQTKGKAATQELKLQLGEAGINAMNALSKRLGISQGELEKRLEEGKVSSKDAIMAVYDFIGEKYPGLMNEMSGTLAGMDQKLKGKFQDTLTALGTAFSTKLFKTNSSGSNGILDLLDSIEKKADVIAKTVLDVLNPVWQIIKAASGFVTGLFDGISVSQGDVIDKMGKLELSFEAWREAAQNVVKDVHVGFIKLAFAAAILETKMNIFNGSVKERQMMVDALRMAEKAAVSVTLATYDGAKARRIAAAEEEALVDAILAEDDALKKAEAANKKKNAGLDLANAPNQLAIGRVDEFNKKMREEQEQIMRTGLAFEDWKAKAEGLFDDQQLEHFAKVRRDLALLKMEFDNMGSMDKAKRKFKDIADITKDAGLNAKGAGREFLKFMQSITGGDTKNKMVDAVEMGSTQAIESIFASRERDRSDKEVLKDMLSELQAAKVHEDNQEKLGQELLEEFKKLTGQAGQGL
jgi:tape measure domain-containing protein